MLKTKGNVIATLLVAAILTTTGITVFASDNDGCYFF